MATVPRKFAAPSGDVADHPVRLVGLRDSASDKSKPPFLVERRDQDFVAGLLADLQDDTTRAALLGQGPGVDPASGRARLFAPVQRVFNVAVIEAFCDEPGQPRVDRAKIESAGMVLRRVDRGPGGTGYRAWIKAGTKFFGWQAVDEDVDPAADKRAPAASVGHPYLNALLPSNKRVRRAGADSLGDVEVTEHVIPLFVAPPDVCVKARKTFLFGTVPVSSDERTESDPVSPHYGQTPGERADLAAHLVNYLRAGAKRPFTLAGQVFTTEWVLAAAPSPEGTPDKARFRQIDSHTLKLLVQQLHIEFDAFGTSVPSCGLRALLDQIHVEYDSSVSGVTRTTTESAGAFLEKVRDVLLTAVPGATFTVPHRWGAVSAALADSIFSKVLQCLDDQYRKLKPGKSRFERDNSTDPEPAYVVRCFIRIKPEHPGCPSRLVWSACSKEFTIAPWYESAGTPPTLVPLPDLFDRNLLKKLKPGVAFVLPPKLAGLLKSDPMKLRDGEGGGIDIGWICSFSIPIITLCAFIVLMIFLQILNLIFFWLPFLKICIPFPKKS